MSEGRTKIEHMFEDGRATSLIDQIGDASRAESAAIARRLGAVGQLDALRTVELVECRLWRTDPYEEVAAEISAAQNISRGRAAGQIHFARVLRDELICVAEVFGTGAIDYRMVAAIINRTENVEAHVKRELDSALARHCTKWMRLSDKKLAERIDLWVAKHDPAAVRVPPKVKDNRYVEIIETSPGMAGIWASLDVADAAVFDATLDALAATVCDNDPRTNDQRRSDALAPLARRESTLQCQCGSPDCASAAERKAVSDIVINVLAEQATLEGANHPGYLPGFGILPAESVRDLADAGATVKPVKMPTGAEPNYRASKSLSAFVQWRDLTCRFPGCDDPAEVCDVDHTKPHPYGPTHPSNTKLYCRTHHLVKTFYAGFGWQERQFPNGVVVWTAPTGHTYSTEPHGGTLFPALAQPTGDLGDIFVPDESPNRGVMMPTRRQTREQDREERIARERRERKELNKQVEREEAKRRKWLAANYEPPPF
jgi:hypothetical protein